MPRPYDPRRLDTRATRREVEHAIHDRHRRPSSSGSRSNIFKMGIQFSFKMY